MNFPPTVNCLKMKQKKKEDKKMKNYLYFLIIILCIVSPFSTRADGEDIEEKFSWDYYVPSFDEMVRVGEKAAAYKYISLPVYWPTKEEKKQKKLLFNFAIDVEESFKKQGPCLGISKDFGKTNVFLTNDISNNLDVKDDFIKSENPFKQIGVGVRFKF